MEGPRKELSMNYIVERIKKIGYMLDQFSDSRLNVFQKSLVVLDMGLAMLLLGCGITDYFQYKFYKKRYIDRRQFIVHRKRMKIVRTCNDKKDRQIFDDKTRFNERFSDYITRDWLNSQQASLEDFRAFTNKHQRFIVKPMEGSHGRGIYRVQLPTEESLDELYNKIQGQEAIIEETIKQDQELADFNPASVNTLRVVTLIDSKGEVHIMSANLRVGRGERIADNFHHQGIASLIDIESGLVMTRGIDGKGHQYVVHPISEKPFVGFKIPYWDKVKKTVMEAAQVVPTVRYVGWDVALGEGGRIYLVEGNAAADPDISQLPDQVGKWPLYKDLI